MGFMGVGALAPSSCSWAELCLQVQRQWIPARKSWNIEHVPGPNGVGR